MRASGLEVGRVAALWRYPVKSMGGEGLEEVELDWHGLAGDRRWAFVRDGVARSGFPWQTIRQRPDMGHYRPSFLEPGRPDASPTVVRTPAGEELDVVDPALAAQLGEGVRVIKQDRGVFDVMPLSLITTQTVEGVGALVGAELDVQRFRPNLLVEAAGAAAFPEDCWVGSVLRIGDMRMRVDQRDGALRPGQRRSGHDRAQPGDPARHRSRAPSLPRGVRLAGSARPCGRRRPRRLRRVKVSKVPAVARTPLLAAPCPNGAARRR